MRARGPRTTRAPARGETRTEPPWFRRRAPVQREAEVVGSRHPKLAHRGPRRRRRGRERPADGHARTRPVVRAKRARREEVRLDAVSRERIIDRTPPHELRVGRADLERHLERHRARLREREARSERLGLECSLDRGPKGPGNILFASRREGSVAEGVRVRTKDSAELRSGFGRRLLRGRARGDESGDAPMSSAHAANRTSPVVRW